MSCIPLTASQKAELQTERNKLQSRIDKYNSIAGDRVTKEASRQEVDSAFQTAFLYWDGIVVNYENEREELTGEYVEDPIVEADMNNPGSLIASRTTPENPVTDIIRITQFDGTPLITTDNEISGVIDDVGTTQLDIEPYWMAKQATIESWLSSGFGGTSPTTSGNMSVVEAITPTTTSITIESSAPTESFNFQIGDTFVIKQGSNQVGVLVTNVVSQENGDPDAGFCTPTATPDTEAQCTIEGGTWTSQPVDPSAELEIIVLTGGSVSASGILDSSWSGFANADRIAKVDSTDGYTYMMSGIISLLETFIGNRQTKLTNQETALNANDDPDLDPTALINVQTSNNFLTTYLLTTDISDTGLASLASERATRSSQITTRISDINAAFTGQPSGNFYDFRYTEANNRGNTAGGSLRLLRFEQATTAVINDIKALSQDRIDSIDALLALACP